MRSSQWAEGQLLCDIVQFAASSWLQASGARSTSRFESLGFQPLFPVDAPYFPLKSGASHLVRAIQGTAVSF